MGRGKRIKRFFQVEKNTQWNSVQAEYILQGCDSLIFSMLYSNLVTFIY